MRIPLCLPAWDEKKAFKLNAEYEEGFGFYVTDEYFEDDFIDWLPQRYNPLYKEPWLLPDMLPSSAWADNVRSNVSPEKWDKLRRYCYAAAGHRCEICGQHGMPHLEAHEDWKFDDITKVQKLRKLIALCPLCHKAKHLGYAKRIGLYEVVLNHMLILNGWSLEQLTHYMSEAKQTWQERSKFEWTLDLSWLNKYGVL